MLDQARAEGASIADREMVLETPAFGRRIVAIDLSPLAERRGLAVADLAAGALDRRQAGRGDEPPRRHACHGNAGRGAGP